MLVRTPAFILIATMISATAETRTKCLLVLPRLRSTTQQLLYFYEDYLPLHLGMIRYMEWPSRLANAQYFRLQTSIFALSLGV